MDNITIRKLCLALLKYWWHTLVQPVQILVLTVLLNARIIAVQRPLRTICMHGGEVIYDIFACHGRSNHWWDFFAPILRRTFKYFIKSEPCDLRLWHSEGTKSNRFYFDTSLPGEYLSVTHDTRCSVSIRPLSFPRPTVQELCNLSQNWPQFQVQLTLGHAGIPTQTGGTTQRAFQHLVCIM